MLDRIFDLNKIQNSIMNFNDKIKDEYYNYLINEFGVLFTFHSNRIEGTNTTLTLNDTRKILNNTYDILSVVDKNKKREINETINHQNAFKYIFEILDKNLDIITVIKNLHQIIGSNIIEGAGSYKERDNYLINSNGEEVSFTSVALVEKRMLELKDKYENDWKDLTVFEKAVNLHMAVINIHPFSDGNGRTARLIMNYELIKNNYPPILINESQKLSYYSIIEEINTNTNYQNKPLNFGDIKVFNETIQQLSILTFKNMQKFYDQK
ncbi:MAG: Fic family protein [Bacilli bacterium]|nr:Fic family protein [Bacilli bacterium]